MTPEKQVPKNVTLQSKTTVLEDPQTIESVDPERCLTVEIHKPSAECMERITKQVHMSTTSMHADDEADERNMAVGTAMLNGISPRDDIEAMIAGQMIAVHGAIMTSCTYASLASVHTPIIRGEAINHVAKLNKSFTSLVETLNRYRHQDKVYQNLTVGHVDVHHGGQAVVGNMASNGSHNISSI